jgi:7-cyano-7-deazaguanine synthase
VNVAAAYAESLGAGEVVAGFNREEARTFPDNSAAFMRRATAALALSTRSGVRLVSPTARLTKTGIVRLGMRLGAPLGSVWSCYEGGTRMCGSCESCARLVRALDRAEPPPGLRPARLPRPEV